MIFTRASKLYGIYRVLDIRVHSKLVTTNSTIVCILVQYLVTRIIYKFTIYEYNMADRIRSTYVCRRL